MKRKNIKKFTLLFLTLFLICICILTFSTVSVNATEEEFKTDYKTTDKKPTYTETLNKNNELLKKLTKEETRKDKVLKKIKSDGKDWVNNTVNVISAIQNSSGEDPDYEKITMEISKKLISSIAGIWGFGGVTEAILEGIETLTSSGSAPLSEVQVLSYNIDQRFNEMSDKLNDIEEELGALSDQVTSSVNDILSGTQAQINNLEAKQIIRSFMSSGEGNFSYLEYSNYLYGNDSNFVNASEAYYILLLEAIQSGASMELIEYYYNKLFDSIYSNIHIYNQYFYGDIAGMDKSISSYYYDYLQYNPNLVKEGTTAEYEALLFALDLYTTYVYSYEILEMCFAWISASFYLDSTLEVYEYAEGKTINNSTLQEELSKMDKNLQLAEEQIVEDIVYILGMKDSYVVVDGIKDEEGNIIPNGDIHSIGNYGESFGNIAEGQTIYLSVMPDEICKLFSLNTNKFRYYVNDTEYIGAKKAVIKSDEINTDSFLATVKYGDIEIYNIEFTKIDNIYEDIKPEDIVEFDSGIFSGGSGTKEDPYLISNAAQFYMVKYNLDASYKLIKDITLAGSQNPIGTEKKPYKGIFDGNGHTISDLKIESLIYDSKNITMNPTTGMFGKIGSNGVVKNLTLKGMKVFSDYKKDGIYPENDNSYFYIGGIAGINEGLISNCTIDDSSINVNRIKETEDSRTVSIYVGGITGSNRGIIEYCSNDDLEINAISYLYYYNQSIYENEHSLFVGGISGETYNIIKNCRVSKNTKISAYAKSIADSQDRERPILTVYTGGIVAGSDASEYLSNIYSACNIAQCRGEIYNDGKYWGEHRYSWDNVEVKSGIYYPVFFPLSNSKTIDDYEMIFYSDEFGKVWNEEIIRIAKEKGYPINDIPISVYEEATSSALIKTKENLINRLVAATQAVEKELAEKIVLMYEDDIFLIENGKIGVEIELTDNMCNVNSMYLTDYFDKLIDTEKELKNVKFVDKNGNVVDVTIVGYYGFYTYNSSEESQSITVKVFFNVDGVLMSDEIALSIKGNEIIDWKIEGLADTPLDREWETDGCYKAILERGFRLIYIYSNGQTKEIYVNQNNIESENIKLSGLDTIVSGKQIITVEHGDYIFEGQIEIKCIHNFVKDETATVKANCKLYGYEVWKCAKEGCNEEIHKNYVKGDHTYVKVSGQEPTCKEDGYTDKIYCSVCDPDCKKPFKNEQWIQALPHNYVSADSLEFVDDGEYNPDEYHYCTEGKHYEPHQYMVSEYVDESGHLVYRYICYECQYVGEKTDNNIITDEQEELPTVFVTDGYVLNVGDEVVVYVELLNNPKFNAANFGIRYTEGLELVKVEEGSIIPQQLQASNPVHQGYNFAWADGEKITSEDGYLLKLTFKFVCEELKKQTVSIVYNGNKESGNFEGGFTTLDDKYGIQQFMSKSGTISVVEHLPGDVDNDNDVDIMDATYIAWQLVGKKDENGNLIKVNSKYGDVNLSGGVDINDVLWILQSISGRYGKNLLNSDYELFFNLNGFVSDVMNESKMVKFYDEDGNRIKWSENIDFESYKEVMKQLGYKFVGWYTRMDCICEEEECTHFVKIADYIAYDHYQGKQTLYARWEENKIIFDMNGADCEQFEEKSYLDLKNENTQITLDIPIWSYNVKHIVDGEPFNGKIYKEFLGWKDENGNIITEIDLSTANLGNIKLTATWSEYQWITPNVMMNGYKEITDWYLDEYCTESDIINTIDEKIINKIKNNEFKIYTKKIPIDYTITYNNLKNSGFVSDCDTYNIEKNVAINNDLSCIGYVFDGWYNNPEYTGNIITEIKVGTTGNIELYAKWIPKVYEITIKGINPNPSGDLDDNDNPIYEEIELQTKIYFTYGDENVAQGFYAKYENNQLLETIDSSYITSIMKKEGLNTNFSFEGLYYGGSIVNNGHSYAGTGNNTNILSKEGNLVYDFSNDIVSKFDETNKIGTLYALIKPITYTITLDNNASSQHELEVNNTPTSKIEVFYNEKYLDTLVMPTSKYYVPVSYVDVTNGMQYFSADGACIKYYDMSGPTTMKCQWTKYYTDYIYIYSPTTLADVGSSIPDIGSLLPGLGSSTSNEYKKYLVIKDINMEGAEWTPKYFYNGLLDGDGHAIYNFTIKRTGETAGASVGLFLQNSGTIKNLTIGKEEAHYDSKYSVKYSISYTESSDSASNLYVGGLVGKNLSKGTIENCKLINTYIDVNFYDADNDEDLKLYVGGITAGNSGTINNCYVTNSKIEASAKCSTENSGDDNYVWLGGICGINNSTINNCTAKDNNLDLEVRGDGFYKFIVDNNEAYPWGTVGGIVGEQKQGTTSGYTAINNTIKKYGSSGDYTHPTLYEDAVCGLKSGGLVIASGATIL